MSSDEGTPGSSQGPDKPSGGVKGREDAARYSGGADDGPTCPPLARCRQRGGRTLSLKTGPV